MIKVETIEAFGWKNCVKLSAAGVELIVATDVGPRIVSYSFNGKANHLCEFKEQQGKSGEGYFVPYGGHRVWHAPELDGRTNTADNDACVFQMTESSIIVESAPDSSGIIRGMEIFIDEDGVVTIDNILKNANMWDIELSIWGITQFAMGGVMAVPTSKIDSKLVANRVVSLWPYSAMNDSRVYWGKDFVTVTPDKKIKAPFKFGVSADEQYAVYFNHNQMIVKEFAYYFEADYPNYFCNFESYVNDDFIEIESLSPMMTLAAGDEAVHTEIWRVFDDVACPNPGDEAAIAEKIKANFTKGK